MTSLSASGWSFWTWRLQTLSEQSGVDAHRVCTKNDRDRDHFTEIEPTAGIVQRARRAKDDRAHEAEPDNRLDDKI